jgi:trehalose 6-phosphate phosphatase
MTSTVPCLPIEFNELALLLDVDGTLLDIAATPNAVRVPDSLRRRLARLARRLKGAVALISGRSVADLDGIFAPLRLPAVGGHGAEIRSSATGNSYRRRSTALDPALKRRLFAIAECGPGVVIEDKGYSLAIHYRLAPEREHEVREAVAAIWADEAPRALEVLPGKAVVEIKHSGFNKGTAIRELMACAPFRGRRPVFIGDDTTDEAAFAVLPEFAGMGISVGRTVAGVTCHFETPRQVRRWLKHLSEAQHAGML